MAHTNAACVQRRRAGEWETGRHADRQAGRQTDRQAHIPTYSFLCSTHIILVDCTDVGTRGDDRVELLLPAGQPCVVNWMDGWLDEGVSKLLRTWPDG